MSTLTVATVKSNSSSPPAFQNTSGTEIGRLCRAFVNFDGTTGTIRAQYNVSSVTFNGTGDYTINFSTAMPDANYSMSATASGVYNGTVFCTDGPSDNAPNPRTSSAIRFGTRGGHASGGVSNPSYVNVAIFR